MIEATNKTPPRPTPKRAADHQHDSVTTRALDVANDAGHRIVREVERNPLAVVAGGIALGLVAGALLPKTRREAKLLGAIGARLNDGAVAAVRAAKTAGTAELAAAGLSRVNANNQVGKLVDAAMRALVSAGTAAKDAAIEPAKTAAKTPTKRAPAQTTGHGGSRQA